MQHSPASSPSDEAAIDNARITPSQQISRSADRRHPTRAIGSFYYLASRLRNTQIKEYLMGYEQWMAKGQAIAEMARAKTNGRRRHPGLDARLGSFQLSRNKQF